MNRKRIVEIAPAGRSLRPRTTFKRIRHILQLRTLVIGARR